MTLWCMWQWKPHRLVVLALQAWDTTTALKASRPLAMQKPCWLEAKSTSLSWCILHTTTQSRKWWSKYWIEDYEKAKNPRCCAPTLLPTRVRGHIYRATSEDRWCSKSDTVSSLWEQISTDWWAVSWIESRAIFYFDSTYRNRWTKSLSSL